jgi:hypothetical protein
MIGHSRPEGARPVFKLDLFICCLIFLIGFTAYYFFKTFSISLGDPDHFYHLAVSRISSQTGLITQLPQVEDIGWGRYFPDKEFLFHVITRWGYEIGGDKGVELIPLLLGALICVLTFFASLGPSSASLSLMVCSLVFFLCPRFVFRISMLRPHMLAIPLFVLLLMGLQRKNRWIMFIACFLFPLSYHAFYVPGVLLVIEFLVGSDSWSFKAKSLGLGIGGIIAGLLVNPYFPSNILMSWDHIKVAWDIKEGASLHYGEELYPLLTTIFTTEFRVPLVVFGLVLLAGFTHAFKVKPFRFIPDSEENGGGLVGGLFILEASAAGFFWLLALLSPRAIEYAVPITAIFSARTLGALDLSRKKYLAFGLSICLIGAAHTYGYFKDNGPSAKANPLVLEQIKKIPSKNAKVFNCDWGSTPYILYARPDLRFLDILDPSFLLNFAPEKHKLREALVDGSVPDPFFALKNEFHADYVFCPPSNLTLEFDSLPEFRKLDPPPPKEGVVSPYAIYELKPERSNQNVLHFEAGEIQNVTSKNYLGLKPQSVKSWKEVILDASYHASTYLDLFKWQKRPSAPTKMETDLREYMSCVGVRPTPSEMLRAVGSTFIHLGGGRHVRLWLNGQPLFQSDSVVDLPRTVNIFLPLKKPISASDRVEAIVCSQNGSPYMGYAMGFWTQEGIAEECRWKSLSTVTETSGSKNKPWPLSNRYPKNCMGPLAIDMER